MAFADYRGLTPAQRKALREKRNYLAIQLRGLDNDMVNKTEFLWRQGDVRAMKSSYRLPFTEGILEGKISSGRRILGPIHGFLKMRPKDLAYHRRRCRENLLENSAKAKKMIRESVLNSVV